MSSRRARARSQHPRRCAVNAIDIAINGARKLSRDDVEAQHRLMMRAQDEFARGIDCARHWLSLADTGNMAETLAGMGLGSGPQADEVIERAQKALHDVHQRHETRGTWTLYADEIDALLWLVQVHHVQLGACSYSEFARAFDVTRERMTQARNGNAPAGALVVVGQLVAGAAP
jgi:hypothetical protein